MSSPLFSRRAWLGLARKSRVEDTVTKSVPTARPAIVLESKCLAWQGTVCSVCREHCAVAGAIVIDRGRPTIDPNRCTGCGDCVAVCPAPEGGAIACMPKLVPGQRRRS